MQPRRSLRLVAGALVLLVPLLGSCGFDKATDRVYTPGVGTNDRAGTMKILAAVVVAAQPGSGTFVASLANDSRTDDDQLTEIAGAGKWTDLTVVEPDSPIAVEAHSLVNLADEGGIKVSGDFGAGDYLDLTLSFASGYSVTMYVPVVYACDEYTGLDTSAGTPSSSASPTESAGESASAEATGGPTPSPSDTDAASPSPSTETYDCAALEGS